MPQTSPQLYLIGHECLRALKHACRRMYFTDSLVEAIFCGNARGLMERDCPADACSPA